MLSGKFSCERTLFKKDLARFWPLCTAYTVLWFLIIPLNVFSSGERMVKNYANMNLTGWAGDLAMEMVCGWTGTTIALFYGALCAMAVWSYLYNTRAVNMTHALPVRREGHFAAHFLSGAAFFTLPHIVIFLLSTVAGAVRGSSGDLGRIAAAMGLQTLLCLFFFCFATLCAFVTGHSLALPILYGIFNFLVYGVTGLLDWTSSKFLFGVTSGLEQLQDVIRWLTPLNNLGRNLKYYYSNGYGYSTEPGNLGNIPTPENAVDAAEHTITRQIDGLHLVWIYAVVGVVFAALALLLYRRRHLETAGDVVAVPWLRPMFQYGVALCAALAGAYITADILRENSQAVLAALLAVWGIIGYFVARMFLHKTLKVFKSGWKGAAATAAVLLALCAGLWMDVLGIESRVPDAAQIEQVYVSGPQSAPGDTANYPTLFIDDRAQIEQILNIHRTIVAHRAELKAAQSDLRWDSPDTRVSLKIEYYGKDDDVLPFMQRNYSTLVLFEDELNDPESLAYTLNEYINAPDVIRAAYGLDKVEPGRMTQVLVNGLYHAPDEVEYVTLYSPLSDFALSERDEPSQVEYPGHQADNMNDKSIAELRASEGPVPAATDVPVPTRSDNGHRYQPASLDELGELWDAVLADFDEGNLGRRWLFYDEYEKNICLTSLEFYQQVKVDRPGREDYYREQGVVINLTPQARHTLEAMERLGLFENGAYAADINAERVYPQ